MAVPTQPLVEAPAPESTPSLYAKGEVVLGDSYQIIHRLWDSSNLTQVYRALGSPGLGETALKFFEEPDEVTSRLVDNELSIHSEVSDLDCVVTLYSTGVQSHNDRLRRHAVMPFMRAGNLAHKIARQPGDIDMVLDMGQKVAAAAAQLHGHGIVHRDLKPANILIGDQGEYLITDFGTAIRLEAGDPAPELVKGTVGYAAPETYVPDEPVGPKTDVFSLGVVLFNGLTHEQPFDTKEHRYSYVVTRESPASLRSVVRGVPVKLDALVQDCLSRDPADRPTPTEVRAELQTI